MIHSIISQLFLIIQSLQWYRCELLITPTIPLSHEWVDKAKNFSL